MKRYIFPLAGVLRVRRVQEDQARQRLVLASIALRDAEAEVERRIARYLQLSAARGEQSVDDLLRERFLWEQAAEAVRLAGVARDEAAQLVEERRLALLEATRQVEILERLDTRKREEWELAARREETVEVDDLVTGRFKQTQAGAGR